MAPQDLDFVSVLRRSSRPEVGYADIHELGSVITTPRMWLVLGYDEATAVLRDHRRFSSQVDMGFGGDMFGKTMVFVDPPDHTRLRGVVSRAFHPKALAALEPRIREIARSLLESMEPGQPFDVMSELARPLPVIVIAEMLGLDADAHDVPLWEQLGSGMSGMSAMAPPPVGGPLHGLFDEAIAARRRESRDDLISLLVAAERDGTIDDVELLGACTLLFVAGNVTTTGLLGNAVHALANHPDQCRAVADDPGLLPNAIEEVFRYDPPVPAVPPRRALVDTVVGRHEIPAGAHVTVFASAANRDPRRFPDADTFDITRPDAHNHLAFGAGIHFCLGAPLSRLEARVAMEELLARAPALRLAEETPDIPFDGDFFLQARRRVPIAV